MENLSFYTIIILYLPGLIAARLDMYYGSDRNPSVQNQLTNVIIFGSAAHIFAALLYFLVNKIFALPSLMFLGFSPQYDVWFFSIAEWKNSREIILNNCIDEIAISTLVSILNVAAWLKIVEKQIVQVTLHKLKLTRHMSEKDLWTQIHSQKIEENEFVNLRDIKNDVLYSGWVEMYSEYDNFRELMLYDVTMFKLSTMEELYQDPIPSMYISRPISDVVLGFPRRRVEKLK